jgi:hypothetical protein
MLFIEMLILFGITSLIAEWHLTVCCNIVGLFRMYLGFGRYSVTDLDVRNN